MESERKTSMKILIVLTSHDQLGNTGEKTGFWLEEFASPYYVFKDANAEVTLASPSGGQPPLDPKSDQPDFQTEATERFKQDNDAQLALANTLKLSDISADGTPLVKGKSVTGFSNTEEDAVQLSSIVPFLLEDELKAKGANYSKVDDWHPYAITDGNLITGQNPASSDSVAKAVLEKLEALSD